MCCTTGSNISLIEKQDTLKVLWAEDLIEEEHEKTPDEDCPLYLEYIIK